MMNLYHAFSQFCATIVAPLANLAARIYMGYFIFFVSGLQKFSDMEETIELFEDDYAVPFLPAEPAAYLATFRRIDTAHTSHCWPVHTPLVP